MHLYYGNVLIFNMRSNQHKIFEYVENICQLKSMRSRLKSASDLLARRITWFYYCLISNKMSNMTCIQWIWRCSHWNCIKSHLIWQKMIRLCLFGSDLAFCYWQRMQSHSGIVVDFVRHVCTAFLATSLMAASFMQHIYICMLLPSVHIK